MEIRRLAEQEAREIHDFFQKEYGQAPWTIEMIEKDLAKDFYYGAYADEGLCGLIAYQSSDYEEEVNQILVAKSHRRQGLAQRLLAFLDRSKDCFLEVRASNVAAQTLYQKMGFLPLATRKDYYHDPVEDAIVMRREKHA